MSDQKAQTWSSPGIAKDSDSSKCVESVSAGRTIARNLLNSQIHLINLKTRILALQDAFCTIRNPAETYLVCACSLDNSILNIKTLHAEQQHKQVSPGSNRCRRRLSS